MDCYDFDLNSVSPATAERLSKVDDRDYMEGLDGRRLERYLWFRYTVVTNMDVILKDLGDGKGTEELMDTYKFNYNEVALLVRLGYLSRDEATIYGLSGVSEGISWR